MPDARFAPSRTVVSVSPDSISSVPVTGAGFVHVATVQQQAAGIVRLRLGNDLVLELPMDIDPQLMALVVKALRAC